MSRLRSLFSTSELLRIIRNRSMARVYTHDTMRYRSPTLLLLLLLAAIPFAALLYSSATSQSRNKNQNQNSNGPGTSDDVVKVDVDLVKIDALVMQKKTARIVGGVKTEDFLLYEDGTKQES
jgi:hypothetical protein